MTPFVPASALYDVESGERIRPPAHDATPAEVATAVGDGVVTRQRSLGEFGSGTRLDLSDLTDAERAAYVAVRLNGVGMREHAHATDWSAGG